MTTFYQYKTVKVSLGLGLEKSSLLDFLGWVNEYNIL